MVTVFHDGDNECAPFPHRVVVTRDLATFVICAECDHYIMRPCPDCGCSQNCHYLGELLSEAAGRVAPTPTPGYTGPIAPRNGAVTHGGTQ